MKENRIQTIMYILMAIGDMLVITGVGLIIFTDIHLDRGVEGVLIVATTIAAGLFLLLPTKIYLTLQLMSKNDKKQKQAQKEASDK